MKTRSPIFRFLFALIIVLLSTVSAMAEERHVGKVVFASEGKLVISDVDDTNEVFAVPDAAKIIRNGKAASLSDLAEGDAVTVTATRKKGKLVAKTIVATTGK